MYFDYYFGLLSENYDIDSINDLIFKFKDTEKQLFSTTVE